LRAMRHGRDNAIGLGGVQAASHLRHDKPNQIDLGQESHKANRRRPSVDGLKHVSLSAILTGKVPPRGSSRGEDRCRPIDSLYADLRAAVHRSG
jgi:hypothetical protein